MPDRTRHCALRESPRPPGIAERRLSLSGTLVAKEMVRMAETEPETRSYISWHRPPSSASPPWWSGNILTPRARRRDRRGRGLAVVHPGRDHRRNPGLFLCQTRRPLSLGGGAAGIRAARLRRRALHRHHGMDDLLGEHHRHRDGGRIVWQLRQRHVRQRERGLGQSVRGSDRARHDGVNIVGSRSLPAPRA